VSACIKAVSGKALPSRADVHGTARTLEQARLLREEARAAVERAHGAGCDFLLIDLAIAKTLLESAAASTDPNIARRRLDIARRVLEAVDRFAPRLRVPAADLQAIRSRYAEVEVSLRSLMRAQCLIPARSPTRSTRLSAKLQ
jgi:hypothetical protein